MNILREYYELCDGGKCSDFLTETEKRQTSEGTAMFLTGIFQRAGVKNGNGRTYSQKILQREDSNYQKAIKERRAIGELDHPSDSIINLKNASHLVIKTWWDGDALMGKVQILDTPSGNILKSLINSNVTLGISSRGLGTVSEGPQGTMVNEDYSLICYDLVSEPSTPGAYIKLSEAKQADINQIYTKADRINRILNDILEKGNK